MVSDQPGPTELEIEIQIDSEDNWVAVDDSGTQVDMRASFVGDPRMSPAADRILYDQDDNVVGIFPANWAVFKMEQDEDDD